MEIIQQRVHTHVLYVWLWDPYMDQMHFLGCAKNSMITQKWVEQTHIWRDPPPSHDSACEPVILITWQCMWASDLITWQCMWARDPHHMTVHVSQGPPSHDSACEPVTPITWQCMWASDPHHMTSLHPIATNWPYPIDCCLTAKHNCYRYCHPIPIRRQSCGYLKHIINYQDQNKPSNHYIITKTRINHWIITSLPRPE